MKGLATILPIALTVYVILWLLTTAESVMHRVITLVLPDSLYWPGLGLIAGLLILFVVGSAVNAYLVRVNWVSPGQTWRNLSEEKTASLVAKADKFARAAGVPAMA